MQKHTPKILVIEDAKALMPAWTDKFQRQGFEVLTADNSKSAITVAVQDHPDAVVVDLPDTEGTAIVKKLREYKWASQTPVMMLNNWRDPELISHYTEGMDEYLAYNWSLEGVVQKVKQRLALA